MSNELLENSELSILKRKKTTLSNRVDRLREEIKSLTKDINALDQTIKLFANDKTEKKQVYSFARGELKKLLLNEDRIDLINFTNKIIEDKNLNEDFNKIKASVNTTIYKLVKEGILQKLGNGIYINKYSNHQS